MAADRLVAIHQPNFFPWLGYFDKIRRADVFVVLDSVQFPRMGKGNWSNRVRLLVGGQAAWITMPVKSSHGELQKVSDVEIAEGEPWRTKVCKTVRSHYAKAPHFRDVFPWLEPLILNPTHSLTEYNLAATRAFCDVLHIDTSKIILSSSLEASGHATDLLISIVLAVGGTAYLSGDGAGGYQEEEKYASAGVGFVLQQFAHPTYTQVKQAEFVPGLSAIDALLNCGFDGTARLLAGEGAIR